MSHLDDVGDGGDDPMERIDFLSLLPPELGLEICSYLDARGLSMAREVSPMWGILATDELLYHALAVREFGLLCPEDTFERPFEPRRRTYSVCSDASDASETSSRGPVRLTWKQIFERLYARVHRLTEIAGYFHSLAIGEDGSLWAWGNAPAHRRLALPSDSDVPVVVTVAEDCKREGDNLISTGSVGYSHMAVVSVTGLLYTWGSFEDHKLGHSGGGVIQPPGRLDLPCTRPVLLDPALFNHSRITSVSCGLRHTAAVTGEGWLYTWGLGLSGQLGHGNTRHSRLPRLVARLAELDVRVVAVSAGGGHTLALTENGLVYSMGNIDPNRSYTSRVYGQRRKIRSPVAPPNEPVVITSPCVVLAFLGKRMTCISTRDALSIATSSRGVVYTWGSEPAQSPIPVDMLFGVRIEVVSAGDLHFAGVSSAGVLYAWGRNRAGECGIPPQIATSMEPRPVSGLRGIHISTVSCGARHTIAISENGVMYSFGDRRYGQLGDRDDPARPTVARVDGLPHVRSYTLNGSDL